MREDNLQKTMEKTKTVWYTDLVKFDGLSPSERYFEKYEFNNKKTERGY